MFACGAMPDHVLYSRQSRKTCRRGFTLVELLLVVAIMMTLVAIAIPSLTGLLDAVRIARAVGDVRALHAEIAMHVLFNGSLPDTLAELGRADLLDPWRNPYVYLDFGTAKEDDKWGGTKEGTAEPRKDRFLVPLNSDYDLYSKGKDGESDIDLRAQKSWDDIVRANDGAYIGLASQY